MSLKEQLKEMKSGFLAKAPAEAAEMMARGTQELIDSGAPERALKVGNQLPAFSLNNQDGKSVQSSELLASGPLVLSFYRGKW